MGGIDLAVCRHRVREEVNMEGGEAVWRRSLLQAEVACCIPTVGERGLVWVGLVSLERVLKDGH